MTRIIRGPDSSSSSRRRPSPDATRVLRADQLSLLRESEQTLEVARQQARAIVAKAEADAAALRRQAEEESRTRAAALLCRAEERAAQIVSDARGELTTLGVRIAEKILGEQLRLQPDSVCSIVSQCLRACPSARRVRLRVHPEDLPLVEGSLSRLAGLSSGAMSLCADPQLARGDCVLESELGEVDGRIEAQLARLGEALR